MVAEKSYHGYGVGVWVRDKLIEAGLSGVSSAELFRELRVNWERLGLIFKRGTYHSFNRYFHWLKQLGWVTDTGREAPSYTKGRGGDPAAKVLTPRRYYRITSTGREATLYQWANPLTTLHPEWSPSGERRREYMAEYRRRHRGEPKPRGRPRRSIG